MDAAQVKVAANHRSNPGEALRAARERRGWSVAEVATQLNLPVKRLAQLEAGEFEQLPGNTFARGYIRAYAKLLGLDQAPLVADFDQITGSDSTGSSVHALGRIEEPARYAQGLLRVVSVLLLLALGAVCFYWWQQQGWGLQDLRDATIGHVEVEGADGTTQIHTLDEPDELDEPALLQPAQPTVELALPGVSNGENSQAAASVAPTAPVAALQAAAQPESSPAPAPSPAPVTVQQTAPVQPATGTEPVAIPSQTEVPAQAGEGLISLSFTADCWIQVKDVSGKILNSGVKHSGDSLEVRGRAPLELRLGFARGAQVSYDGKAVDLTPFISNETARLQLGGH